MAFPPPQNGRTGDEEVLTERLVKVSTQLLTIITVNNIPRKVKSLQQDPCNDLVQGNPTNKQDVAFS